MSNRYQQVIPNQEVDLESESLGVELKTQPSSLTSTTTSSLPHHSHANQWREEVDLEIVDDVPISPPQQSHGSHSSLSGLAPPLLHPSAHATVDVPLYRNKYMRCACETGIIMVVMILAFLVGRATTSPDEPQTTTPTTTTRPPPVIVVSFDGMRYDYIDLAGPAATPNFQAIRSDRYSVYAKSMRPSFPSLTFPNHYTLVSGMVPETHGIIANHIFDPTTNTSFIYSQPATQTTDWWESQTIWGLAEIYNISTGTVFWVGSEHPILGRQPNVWLQYDGSLSNQARIDQLFAWIDGGACTLCLIYFSDVDTAGHTYGAASPQALKAVADMDALVGVIQNGLVTRNLDQTASLILLSDHGMASVTNYIYLDDYLDLSPARGLTHEEIGAFLNIWVPRPIDSNLVDEIMTNLTKVPHITCWRKADTPAIQNYEISQRIAPINCICDVGYVTSSRSPSSSWYFWPSEKGVHGYLPSVPEMHAILMVQSPTHFDTGVVGQSGVIQETSNLNVFNLICHLLDISPSPNNGTLIDFAPFMTRP